MKATSIQIGKTYEVKSGRNTTTVKVESFNRKTGGWVCGTQGGKSIAIKDCARFIREVGTKQNATPTTNSKSAKVKKAVTKTERAKGGKPQGTMSGLDAAHRVLTEARRPMNVREILETATQNGYCRLGGATPALTIYAAIQREIAAKGANSRFTKIERGLFAAR